MFDMVRQDFTVFVCENCGKVHTICYRPEPNEVLYSECCGAGVNVKAIPFEEWKAPECVQVLGALLKDDGKDAYAWVGNLVLHALQKAEVEEAVTDEILRGILDDYSKYHALPLGRQ